MAYSKGVFWWIYVSDIFIATSLEISLSLHEYPQQKILVYMPFTIESMVFARVSSHTKESVDVQARRESETEIVRES